MTTKEALEEALADINRLIPIIDNIAWKLTYDAERFRCREGNANTPQRVQKSVKKEGRNQVGPQGIVEIHPTTKKPMGRNPHRCSVTQFIFSLLAVFLRLY